MQIDLSGKIALVTGGSRGIGREICLALAQAGADVIINYRKEKSKAEEVKTRIESQGGRAYLYQADVSVPHEIVKMFDYIRKEHNGLDILVNNAGIIRDNLLLSMEMDEWESVMDTNLRAAFLCTKYAVELMLTRHRGKVINISSTSAIKGGRGQCNYASAKGGLISFTRACAVELAPKGIQVNAVLPGMIVTDMSRRVRKRAGDRILEQIPCGRFGEPSDVAGIVVFLASSLSDYITGQAICVDGGLSIS
jgi:3-oxoacyl-[acyl-carrier protein] reductase